MTERFHDFNTFYSYYLSAHQHAWNRRLHLAGWVVGGAFGAAGLFTGMIWLVPVGVLAALGISLAGHRFVEKNESVVFDYPVWTSLADLRMFYEMATGRV